MAYVTAGGIIRPGKVEQIIVIESKEFVFYALTLDMTYPNIH